jgi:ABC-type nickel/cobalt efflux system permease component RcnA
MDPSTASSNTNARSDGAPRTWSPGARGAVLVLGTAASVVVGYVAMPIVYLAAVMADAAPLGLAGEQTETQPWVDPMAAGTWAVVFLLGTWLTVRTFRRHGRDSSDVDGTARTSQLP